MTNPLALARPGKDANLQVSRPEAAVMLNVSERSIASAAIVCDEATPELQAAVEQGKITVSVAAKAIGAQASRHGVKANGA